MVKLTPENLEVIIKQNRKCLAVWCGPKKRKMGYWFVFEKLKGDKVALRATINEASSSGTIEELTGFIRP